MAKLVNITRPSILTDAGLESLKLWQKHSSDNTDRINDPVQSYLELAPTSDQTLTTATWTPITWAVGIADPTKNITLSSNTSAPLNTRITVAISGVYLVTGTTSFASNNTGIRTGSTTKNAAGTGSTGERRGHFDTGTNPSDVTQVSYSAIWSLVAKDYIEINAYQSSGGNLALLGTVDYRCRCQIRRLGQ